ncbi:MAG TPA: hypothetical protein VGH89_03035 [Pseudonocardia sp.]|jgi:hypothetical protein
MGQHPGDDGLTSAYLHYLITWLHSWPLRRKLEQVRRRDGQVRRAQARLAQIQALSTDPPTPPRHRLSQLN